MRSPDRHGCESTSARAALPWNSNVRTSSRRRGLRVPVRLPLRGTGGGSSARSAEARTWRSGRAQADADHSPSRSGLGVGTAACAHSFRASRSGRGRRSRSLRRDGTRIVGRGARRRARGPCRNGRSRQASGSRSRPLVRQPRAASPAGARARPAGYRRLDVLPPAGRMGTGADRGPLAARRHLDPVRPRPGRRVRRSRERRGGGGSGARQRHDGRPDGREFARRTVPPRARRYRESRRRRTSGGSRERHRLARSRRLRLRHRGVR